MSDRPLRLLLPLLVSAALAATAAVAAPAQEKVAVLEFEVTKGIDLDRIYFSDKVRGGVGKRAPQLFVMTRESTEALLEASGKTIADCTGECEVEIGRKLQADYVVSGRIAKVGSRFALTMRLHRTADGRLLGSEEAMGKDADALVDGVGAAVAQLLTPLAPVPLSAAVSAIPAGPAAGARSPAAAPDSSDELASVAYDGKSPAYASADGRLACAPAAGDFLCQAKAVQGNGMLVTAWGPNVVAVADHYEVQTTLSLPPDPDGKMSGGVSFARRGDGSWSGVMISPKSGKLWAGGWEGTSWSSGLDWIPAGDLTGEHTLRVVVHGRRVQVWLDGRSMGRYDSMRALDGQVAFLAMGRGRMTVRKLSVRDAPQR